MHTFNTEGSWTFPRFTHMYINIVCLYVPLFLAISVSSPSYTTKYLSLNFLIISWFGDSFVQFLC